MNKYPQDPLRNDVAYVAAETLLQQGEHAAAAEAYSKLIQADGKNPAASMWSLRQAMANYLGGKYQAAIDLLTKELPKFQDTRQKAEQNSDRVPAIYSRKNLTLPSNSCKQVIRPVAIGRRQTKRCSYWRRLFNAKRILLLPRALWKIC